jgi:hypothetical protein
MTSVRHALQDDEYVRRRWLAGVCPCCGAAEFDNWTEDGPGPAWIGEGVRICGWCVHRGHDAGDITAEILRQCAP